MRKSIRLIRICLCGCAVLFPQTILIGCSKAKEPRDQKTTYGAAKALQETSAPQQGSTSVESVDDALVNSAYGGDVDRVRALLAQNASVAAVNRALIAVSRNSVLILKPDSAIDTGVNNKKASDDSGDLDEPFGETARALIERGAKVNFRDEERATPLILAAEHGRTSIVRVLLAKGALVDARDKYGNTALISAACECPSIDMPETLDSLKLLVAKGADVNASNKAGETALMLAAAWGRRENLSFLLGKGAYIDAQDKNGNSALLIAAEGSGVPTSDATRVLLSREGNLELQNRDGETALMLAASKGGFDAVENVRLLLKGGADIRATNKRGQTALDLAKKNHRNETAAILKKAMSESHPLEGERAP